MYTTEELDLLVGLFDEYKEKEEALKRFLTPVAGGLGFHNIQTVDVNYSSVAFSAEWNGPYQSFNTEFFSFPLHLLAEGPNSILQYLKDQKEEENRERLEREKAECAEARRRTYEELKKEFEKEKKE